MNHGTAAMAMMMPVTAKAQPNPTMSAMAPASSVPAIDPRSVAIE